MLPVEKPFHPRQSVELQPDGSVVLEIARAWDDEMIPQLLALGEHVAVLEPTEARERLLATAKAMVERHSLGSQLPEWRPESASVASS